MSQRRCKFTSFKESPPSFKGDVCRYLIYGKETCPTTQKQHWQGYAEFFKKITYKTAAKSLEIDVCTKADYREAARNYCMKENQYTEFGNWEAGGQGSRTDIQRIVNKIEQEGWTDADFLENNPEDIFKYHKFIKNVRSILLEKKSSKELESFAKDFIPNVNQERIIKELDSQNNRQILWVYDPIGNTGKTWLTKYLISQGGIRFENAKTADLAQAWTGESPALFDFSRTLEDRVNYGAIESIKNGMIFSGKYESKCKTFAQPKVVILANFEPNKTKLSADRWNILTL